ncbi:MAG: PstS family phosphate ABC transporter substrate-binding protein [Chloroflexi bacterium]|nr:PstS family phosphate ABC transporter substrate-binding protein [Chloroflexota bacterium]
MTETSSPFTRIRRWAVVGTMAALTSTLLIACTDDEEPAPAAPATSPAASPTEAMMEGIDYEALSGTVRIDGSSTVFPIGEAVAEEFSRVSPVRANVAFSGTGGGFEKFCRGETDFSHASRPMKDSEKELCVTNGVVGSADEIIELQVAIDALTIMANPRNDWVSCLNVEQLHNMFKVDGYTNWNEVDPSFPDAPLTFFVPGTDSGTFDYFVEAIIEGVDEDAGHRGDVTASEDDNILVRGLESDVNSVGYFGFAYFLHAGDALKAIAVDGGDGCVEPAFEAALDGSYSPLSRPLFIYTTETILDENEAALGFAKFYMDNIQTLVPEVGYVTLPEELFQAQLAKLAPFLP